MLPGIPRPYVRLDGPSIGHQEPEGISKLTRPQWARIELRTEVQAAYVSEAQAALRGTAYNASACHSCNIDANGRNSFRWPRSTNELVRRVNRFGAADVDTTAHVTAESLP
jgi:hypothetical protein